MDQQLMTVQQVADRLQVHEETVRRWLRDGELAGVNLGGKSGYRIKSSDIELFLESRLEASKIPA